MLLWEDIYKVIEKFQYIHRNKLTVHYYVWCGGVRQYQYGCAHFYCQTVWTRGLAPGGHVSTAFRTCSVATCILATF